MTHLPKEPSALEELTAKIVEAVPEITDHVGVNLFDQYRCAFCSKKWPIRLPLGDKCPVGRPITLEDVLRALDNISIERFFIGTGGEWLDFQSKGNEGSPSLVMLAGWKLGKSLDLQTPATISFLHQLLCPKS